MKKMKQFLILALSFVASLGLFVACREENSSQSSCENAPTSSVVSSTDGSSSDESTSSNDASSSNESTSDEGSSSSEGSSVCEEHAGGEADCIHKAVCEGCGIEYGEVDEENHAFTVETATWTTGEGEHAGFDVKACVCGLVYDAFDVTNETVTDVDFRAEHIRVMALLDEKYQEETFTAELVDLRYKGESVAERLLETADELLIPVSIFGGETGRQYISFIFTTADGAEHEVKAYVDVIAETPANEAQEIVLTGESYAIRLGRAYEDGNGRTIYFMEGQPIEGAKDVKEVTGIRYATEEEA